MRILLVSSYYPPIQSGSSFYAVCLAKTLREFGHTVGVATVNWDMLENPEEERDIPVWYLPAFIVPPLPFFLNLKLLAFTTLKPRSFTVFDEVLQEFKPDVIHQVNHIFDTALISSLRGKHWKIPVVCTVTTQIRHPNWLLGRMMRMVDRLLLGNLVVRHWEKAICMDSEILRYVDTTYGSSISKRAEIVPYGLPFGWSPAQVGKPEPKIKGKFRIISLGHVHELRDRMDLVAAMPAVLERFPETELIIVGRIQTKAPLKLARKLGIDSFVKFIGEVPHEEVEALLQLSDVHAMWATGEYSGLGTAAIESMACGIPLVTASPEDLFGAKALENWHNIVLIERGNPPQIAQSLIKLLENEELRHRIGKNGQMFVKEFLHWTPIVKKLEAIYREAMERAWH